MIKTVIATVIAIKPGWRDKDGDGKVGIQEAVSAVSGDGKSGGGFLGGLLGKLFGK